MRKKLRSSALSLLMVFAVVPGAAMLNSCVTAQDPTVQGAGVGAGLGALVGALIDRDNRWRGAVIGGLIGGTLGGTVTEVSKRAARQAAAEGRPVAYETQDGFQRVEATPVGYNAQTRCHKVRERVWQDGQLMKDEVTEVCESDKTTPSYEY